MTLVRTRRNRRAASSKLSNPTAPVLELRAIEKRYGGVRALTGTDFCLSEPGTVHGLLGENGSGKSTLLGVLSGQIRPDSGEVLIGGERVSFSTPADALAQGIAMVSQETAVAPHLSVTENVLLGRRFVHSMTGIDWPASRRRAAAVLESLGLDYDLDARVGDLRPDQRQMIEIARALSMEAQILILDEPTSSLTDDEVERLLAVLVNLKERGVSTIFVSHRLGEVLAICDELTVLRDGRDVESGPASSYDAASLVGAMTDGAHETSERTSRPMSSDSRLSIRALSAPGVKEVDLDVRAGEIVGLAGLLGAGRAELLETIFGVRRATAGEILLDGEPLVADEPRAAVERGIGYLPPDRKGQGLVLSMSAAQNLAMVTTLQRRRLSMPNKGQELELVTDMSARMRLRIADPDAPVRTLSGGNQQKVALAKWLINKPRVLLLDEPTRGVDVAAKLEIHQLLREVADSGVALMVSSSENDELLELADRIVVMFRGRVVASHNSGEATASALTRLTAGVLE